MVAAATEAARPILKYADLGSADASYPPGSPGPSVPALELPSFDPMKAAVAVLVGSKVTSSVAALNAEPETLDIGSPAGSKAWAKIAARRSQTAAIHGRRCRASGAIIVCCWSILSM